MVSAITMKATGAKFSSNHWPSTFYPLGHRGDDIILINKLAHIIL